MSSTAPRTSPTAASSCSERPEAGRAHRPPLAVADLKSWFRVLRSTGVRIASSAGTALAVGTPPPPARIRAQSVAPAQRDSPRTQQRWGLATQGAWLCTSATSCAETSSARSDVPRSLAWACLSAERAIRRPARHEGESSPTDLGGQISPRTADSSCGDSALSPIRHPRAASPTHRHLASACAGHLRPSA